MAKFDADALGKRLERLNREKLATLERVSEDLLQELQRKGPVRAGGDARDDAAAAGDREAQLDLRVPRGIPRGK